MLKEFEEADYDLSFSQSRKLTGFNCENSVADYENSCNHVIIQNYMKVLEYIRNGAAETNVNKIKIYGQKFAELLPKLQFWFYINILKYYTTYFCYYEDIKTIYKREYWQ